MLEKGAPEVREFPLATYLADYDQIAVVVRWSNLEVIKQVKYKPGFLGAPELSQQIEREKLHAMMDLLAAFAEGKDKQYEGAAKPETLSGS